MRTRIIGLILFAAAVGVLVVVLKTLNWVPGIMQDGLLRQYVSLDDVKTRLSIAKPAAPSYYPQGLRWPPVRIMAQSKPYLMIIQEYARLDDGVIALVILQSEQGRTPPKLPLEMARKTEHVVFSIKEKEASLDVGTCGSDQQCSRVIWNEGNTQITVIMLAAPSEIVKIADSMIYTP